MHRDHVHAHRAIPPADRAVDPPGDSSVAPTVRAPLAALAVLALLAGLLAAPAVHAQPSSSRVGDLADPVLAAIAIDQAKGGPAATHVVLGRSDVFADDLAATALAGTDGAVLLTDGGPDAPLRPEVAAALADRLVEGACTDPDAGPTVYLAGGTAAISQAVEDELAAGPACVERLGGGGRVETAIAVADQVAAPSGTVLLARADDWADAGAVGAWAAATSSRILVTDTGQLLPAVRDALVRYAPDEVVLVGGTAALSAEVETAAAQVAPVRRVAGSARDATAVAIAEQLWERDGGDVALADGYRDGAWTALFAGAAFAGSRQLPILYTAEDQPTPATAAHLAAVPAGSTTAIGPSTATLAPPAADLDAAEVALSEVARLDTPLMLAPLPGSEELWVAERAGRIQALGSDGATREVLDISATVSTDGERGLLGIAFDPGGTRLFTSSTNRAGDSVIDRFDIADGVVDAASRREVLQVAQPPASNHKGGDLQWGPDGNLWWALGDGGGGGDTYENGQNRQTLLAGLVRIDVDGGDPYVIPADNPFADGEGGAPEKWSLGLRNPFRFSFDALSGDLYIADVGQGAVEEVDWVAAGTGAGSNFGWPIFEGTRPFRGGALADHVPPVWEQTHAAGNCSITGGVVYRGSAIPELYGAYLYTDLCNSSIRAILVEGGEVVQDTDLGVEVGSPVGFGVDHDGEVHVLSLDGPVVELVPAG